MPLSISFVSVEHTAPSASACPNDLPLVFVPRSHNTTPSAGEGVLRAVEETRTLDLRITSAPLYRLSYNGRRLARRKSIAALCADGKFKG